MAKIVIYDNKGLVHDTIVLDKMPGILSWRSVIREIIDALRWAFNSDDRGYPAQHYNCGCVVETKEPLSWDQHVAWTEETKRAYIREALKNCEE